MLSLKYKQMGIIFNILTQLIVSLIQLTDYFQIKVLSLVAILAALTIFPVIFTFDLAPEAGEGLVFKTLPYLFAKMPGSLILSTVFFTLFVFTALTSSIPFIEVVAANLMELKGYSRKKATFVVASGTFIFGIPSALSFSRAIFPTWSVIYGHGFLTIMNTFVSTWVIPIGGLLTAIFVGWVLAREKTEKVFVDKKMWQLWYFFVKWVIPLTILAMILQKSGVFT